MLFRLLASQACDFGVRMSLARGMAALTLRPNFPAMSDADKGIVLWQLHEGILPDLAIVYPRPL